MEIVKKNLFSIIFGVIAILAVAALFWPVSGMYDSLSTLLSQRIDVANKIESIASQQRSMPILSPDETSAAPLEVFPTQSVIDAGTAATAKVSEEAKNMMDLATKTNQRLGQPNPHILLVPDALPKPSEQARFNFANAYANTITNYQRWIDMVDSTAPPSATDVQAEKDKLKDQIDKQRLIYDAQNNVDAQSLQDATDQFTSESAGVQGRMEIDRAQQHRVYLMLPPTFNPLPVDQTIKVGSNPPPEKICDDQVVIWVLDDLMTGIAQANELYSDPASPGGPPQHDIFHSAVKSIEGVDPPLPVISTNAGDLTAGVGGAVPKVPAMSPTGRVCNGLYDAVRYKVRLVVDAAKLPQIIRALEAGQFITVTNVQVTEVVDPAVAASNPAGGLHFGNKPCVRVEIECEELLMRKWTDTFLPDDRKGGLGRAALGSPTDQGVPTDMPYGGPGGPGGPMGGPYGPPGGGPYGPPR